MRGNGATIDAGRAISRSTVYRTLRLLVDAGLLRELRLTNRTAYEHDYGYPDHDHEVEDARWVPLAEAAETLTYEGERAMAGKALSAVRASG